MKTLLYFIIFLGIGLKSNAQKYDPDYILIDSINYEYRFHHLENYFNRYPDKRPSVNLDSTIINRNYRAIFEIKNNRLYLNSLLIKRNESATNYSKNVINKIFPNENQRFLSWVSGLFYVGFGDKKISPQDSLHISYSQYIVLEIKNGLVVRRDDFNSKQMQAFEDYQYQRFTKTKEYAKIKERLKKSTTMSEWEIESHILKNILYYSRKNQLK